MSKPTADQARFLWARLCPEIDNRLEVFEACGDLRVTTHSTEEWVSGSRDRLMVVHVEGDVTPLYVATFSLAHPLAIALASGLTLVDVWAHEIGYRGTPKQSDLGPISIEGPPSPAVRGQRRVRRVTPPED